MIRIAIEKEGKVLVYTDKPNGKQKETYFKLGKLYNYTSYTVAIVESNVIKVYDENGLFIDEYQYESHDDIIMI